MTQKTVKAASRARLELKEIKAEEYIRELVDSAPRLTELQRARLAALLLPCKAGGAATG